MNSAACDKRFEANSQSVMMNTKYREAQGKEGYFLTFTCPYRCLSEHSAGRA
jgi:hypothetical protein